MGPEIEAILMMLPGLTLDEVGRDRFAHQEHGLDVDVECLIPIRLGISGEGHARWRSDPGIIHDDVNLPQLRLDPIKSPPNVGLLSHIAAQTNGRVAECPDFVRDALGVCLLKIGDSNVCALLRRQSAIPRPIPEPPPVTTATFPASFMESPFDNWSPISGGLVQIPLRTGRIGGDSDRPIGLMVADRGHRSQRLHSHAVPNPLSQFPVRLRYLESYALKISLDRIAVLLG